MDNTSAREDQLDFFFWLGIDGVLEPVLDEETFNQKVETEHQRNEDYLNVRTSD